MHGSVYRTCLSYPPAYPPITLHFAARRFPSFVTRPLLTLFALDLIAVVALTSPHPFLPAMSQSHLPAN
jgi:hypothetical protein